MRSHVLLPAAILAATFGGTVLAAGPVSVSHGVPDGMEEIVFAVRSVFSEHWYANIGYFSTDADRKCYGKCGKLCKLSLTSGKMTMLIDDPQGAVRDPAVHYDGRRILFSYRQGGTDNYQLYVIASDGGGLRQLTDGNYDDYRALLPARRRHRLRFHPRRRWVNCWSTQVANI